MKDNIRFYNMPLTLEQHFQNLTKIYPDVHDLFSMWTLIKKNVVDKINYSKSLFVNYSLHDASHSRSILQAIERFLGEERINMLSATDTFMLLACAYLHDYGMALTYDRICRVLGSPEFEDFIKDQNEKNQYLENEEAWAIHNLITYLDANKMKKIKLDEAYYSIVQVLESYLRRDHWKGVKDIEDDLKGLFQGNIKRRFVSGTEGITQICMCHGKSMEELLTLTQRADGIVGDEFHPRFIAAMLRLGDLLDLDNGRFPIWFTQEIASNENMIPELSVMHYQKHEAVDHLLITEKKIEIFAECFTDKNGYQVANLISEWTTWLKEECKQLVLYWNEIAQSDFGRPPGNVIVRINVDGYPYCSAEKVFQMQMSQERVMNLLQGTNIYQDKYVGIREMIQNSIDASLLQLWTDILDNRYCVYGLSKDSVSTEMDMLELLEDNRTSIFENYNINVEVVLDRSIGKVSVIVKDKGIGILPEDVSYMANIGSSKEQNMRIRNLIDKMPPWLKPSGVFGIGLQSVFQMTDCIEFYTRQHNIPERKISLYSYGRNRGRVEIYDISPNADGQFNDNSIPGTNVKIDINPKKLFDTSNVSADCYMYYDPDFDRGDELDIVFTEMCQACSKKIKEVKFDYFKISLISIKIDENKRIIKKGGDIRQGENDKIKSESTRWSFFKPALDKRKNIKGPFGETIESFRGESMQEYSFIQNEAFYWDKKTYRCYHLKVRPCIIDDIEGKKQVFLPEIVPNLYNISYKFNHITNSESIYYMKNRFGRLHAGFLELDVQILDDKPAKYMNIDRYQLRKGSIDEDELMQVCSEILEQWCIYFCEKYTAQGFKDAIGYLLSIILVFYQNLPYELFHKFIQRYQEYIANEEFVLGKEGIPFTNLWDQNKCFEAAVNLDSLIINQNKDINQEENIPEEKQQENETENVLNISLETTRHIPHRLVYIKSVFGRNSNELIYQFQLKGSGGETDGINMDDTARFYDYLYAFFPRNGEENKISYELIQKKVFKPDNRYSNLILDCYPTNFHKGKNFVMGLDYMIERYILSPFDQKITGEIVKLFQKGEEELDGIVSEIMKSSQVKKCVDYVINKRFTGCSDLDTIRMKIQDEYNQFIKNFFILLYEKKEIVQGYNNKNKK